jgi:hypothetical protein
LDRLACTVEEMPKPVYATADELAEAVKKLEGQVSGGRNVTS